MVIKVYVSLVSGNKEIKGKQELLRRLLESKKIEFEEVDITDSANESEKQYMRENSLPKDGQKIPLPPQIFNDGDYCGDYDDFYEANEEDEVLEFLKLAPSKEKKQDIQSEQVEDFQQEVINAPFTAAQRQDLENQDPPEQTTTRVSRVTLGSLSTTDNVIPSDEQKEQQEYSDCPPMLIPRSGSIGKKPQMDTSPASEQATYVNVDFGPDGKEQQQDVRNDVTSLKEQQQDVRDDVTPLKEQQEVTDDVMPLKEQQEVIDDITPLKEQQEVIDDITPLKEQQEVIDDVTPLKEQQEGTDDVTPLKEQQEVTVTLKEQQQEVTDD